MPAPKAKLYRDTIRELQDNVTDFTGRYSFLSKYSYTLGAEDLTPFGEQELIDSGVEFAHRYQDLALESSPFVRSSAAERVVQSSRKWIQGYQQEANIGNEIPILIISESPDSNNTLDHGLCTKFESEWITGVHNAAKTKFAQKFMPKTQQRLNVDLAGANLTITHIISLMDLCSYETVASPRGSSISPFCFLFTEEEWHAYNYYQSLDKYYGRGHGNTLGPTQGVGFVNELLARMTDSPVVDKTSSNRTLDGDPLTFPLGRKLYADFSHDNDMTSVLFALGLYNNTVRLPNDTVTEANTKEADGYSAAWTVPFAARLYFEKMRCDGSPEELVRVIVNGRVVPLVGCAADRRGMCTLGKFVESQSFAKTGGRWSECFS